MIWLGRVWLLHVGFPIYQYDQGLMYLDYVITTFRTLYSWDRSRGTYRYFVRVESPLTFLTDVVRI